MKKIEINGYTRITKHAAKKAYLNGMTIYLVPARLRPGVGPWYCSYSLNRKQREAFIVDEIGAANDFDNYITSCQYYNCDKSRGRYIVYYIKEDEKQ